MMAKKHILQHEYKHNFTVIGITSAQKDYRMCWLLNTQLGWDLKRMPDFCHPAGVNAPAECFPVYQYEQATMLLHVNLVSNKNGQCLLFSQPKNIDYLLLFRNLSEQFKLDEILTPIKKIPQIQTAFLLQRLSGAKKLSEFFYDFEMYLSHP